MVYFPVKNYDGGYCALSFLDLSYAKFVPGSDTESLSKGSKLAASKILIDFHGTFLMPLSYLQRYFLTQREQGSFKISFFSELKHLNKFPRKYIFHISNYQILPTAPWSRGLLSLFVDILPKE
jgi:hypothetical protein